MFTFGGLHAGQLVGAHGALPLLGQSRRLVIHAADRRDAFLSVLISRRGEPGADQMRLEIPFFKRRTACRGEICATMPRAMTSSAIPRPVQWLMGRSLGCSPSRAIICQVCCAVISADRPDRG